LETAAFTRDYLTRFYGDRVQVEYADVSDQQAAERYKELIAKAEQGYCVYPLVFMGEDLVSVGNAEYYQVLRFVRRYFEVVGQP
jgi:disulfide oxidoreductase YuzD